MVSNIKKDCGHQTEDRFDNTTNSKTESPNQHNKGQKRNLDIEQGDRCHAEYQHDNPFVAKATQPILT
jgi:hypothetical protein